MDKVCVLIHNSSSRSISYTSKVYQCLDRSPFYREVEHKEIKRKCKASIVAVIPIKEFKNSVSSRIEFDVIVSYEIHGKEYLKSLDNVTISASDVMGKNFDVFNSSDFDERSTLIAMLSTTDKTVLCFKQKVIEEDYAFEPSSIFCKYLDMDLLKEIGTVAIHKHSPHHILHGIMIVFDDELNYINVKENDFHFKIDVYTRSLSQIRALVHLIYDKCPLSLIVTTPNIRLISEGDSSGNSLLNLDYTQCADSLLKQSSMTLKYLDDCLKEMNKKRDKLDEPDVQIDLFAMGPEEFVKYRNSMLAESEKCVEDLVKSNAQTCDVEEVDSVKSNIQPFDTGEIMEID